MIEASVRLDNYDKPGPVTYTVRLHAALLGESFTTRRCRDFEQLHGALAKQLTDAELPPLPQKHGVWRTAEALNERTRALHAYLAALLQAPATRDAPPLTDFLEVDPRLWALACAPTADKMAQSVIRIQSVHRGRMGRFRARERRQAIRAERRPSHKADPSERDGFLMRCFGHIFA